MTEQVPAPQSRRDLRIAEGQAEHLLLLDLRADQARRRRHLVNRHRHVIPRRSRTAPLITVSLLVAAVTLVTGGVSQANAERAQQAALEIKVEQQRHEALSAGITAEIARRVRVTGAATDRLVGHGEAYATSVRNDALTLARAAVESAGAVVVSVAPVVSPEDLGPLDQALVELNALIETAPAPEIVVADPDSREAPPISAPHYDGELVDTTVVPTPVPAAPVEVLEPPVVVAPEAASEPMVTAPDALDLAVSAQLVATAEQVTALSAEVLAVADANIAEAEAAARAAAEAAAIAKAEAEAQARRIRTAARSDNGDIPLDALCGVGFDKGALMRCDAADALEDLNAAYRRHFGTDLDISSSYRDYAAQVTTKITRGGLAAAPGTSNHGIGLAVDFDGFGGVGQFNLPTYRWMKANAGAYGWYHPSYMEAGGAGPAEPWHWEFGEL